jgi:alpha-glucosidase (family GH31 glycosyl hydrolase)
MLSHRPAGRGHAYRYDLDQRVPVTPVHGERYQIRVLTDPSIVDVTVRYTDGGCLAARRVAPAELVSEHGPRAAPGPDGATEAGHLAGAAAGGADAAGATVWTATATAGEDTGYRIVGTTAAGTQVESEEFALRPARWRADRGRLLVEGPAVTDVADVSWLCTTEGPVRVRFSMRLRDGEHVVGFGERYHALDQRGEILDTVVFEQYKHQGHRTYLPMPYALVVGAAGWGFHVRTSRRCRFDVAATVADRILVEADVSTVDTTLTLRLYAGEPAKVVSEFLSETGPAATPPDWVFRPWMSGNEWNTQARVEAEVARSRAEGIPVGAVVIEAWSDEETFTCFRDARYRTNPDGAPHALADFTFPPDGAWPDPRGMVDRLHADGVRVLLWQIPLIPTDRGAPGSQVRADAGTLTDRGYAVREEDGSAYRNRGWWFPGALLPDFTNPAAREWWLAKRRYLVEELGIDGFKTDGGEHAWGEELRYFDGTRGDQTNNRYPVLYAQAYHELTPVTFSRAGFTGSAASPCHWAGDEDSTWAGLRASITAGLSAGLGGIWYWGWDLGGFSGELPSAELYLRSAAAATFAPILQYHSEFNHHRQPCADRTPWNIAERTGDPSVLDVFRRFATLRERLVGYLVEQAGLGRPLMRPLCFDFPHDERVWDFPLQYQLGDDLLVAPVTEPGAWTWRAYLPAGRWRDLFNGTVHNGPSVVERAVPLDEIPVYRRLPGSARLDHLHP